MFLELIDRIVQHLSVRTSEIFLEFNNTDWKDEIFNEYFYTKTDLGEVLREMIRLLTLPEIMPVFQRHLDEAMTIAQSNPNNVLAFVNLHGVFTALEQVTRLVQIDELEHISGVLKIAWSLPYEQYLAFRMITLDMIENLAYIVNEKKIKDLGDGHT